MDWIRASYRDGSGDLIHNLAHLTIQHNPPIARQSGTGQDALVDVQQDVLLLSWPPAPVKGLQWMSGKTRTQKAHSLKLVRVEATLVQKQDTCCAVCYLLQTAPNKSHWLS